jgi:hypothetical protein
VILAFTVGLASWLLGVWYGWSTCARHFRRWLTSRYSAAVAADASAVATPTEQTTCNGEDVTRLLASLAKDCERP